jgi:hypothetical protein
MKDIDGTGEAVVSLSQARGKPRKETDNAQAHQHTVALLNIEPLGSIICEAIT